MAPAGRAKDILPFLLPADTRLVEVFANGLPFVKDDIYGTGVFQGFGQTVFDGFILRCRQFGLKSAKELVPDDQEHAHVPVEVFAVRSVMYTMMRGSHEDVFQPAHLAYKLGVDKDAPDLRGGIHEDNVQRSEAQERQWNKVNKTVERLEDRRPETNRKIEMLGRVMRDMHCPKKANFMVPAMQPVIKEIFSEQQEQPIGKDIGDRKPVVPVAGAEDHEIDAAEEQVETAVEQHQVNIGKRIFPGIGGLAGIGVMMPMTIIAEQDLESDNDNV